MKLWSILELTDLDGDRILISNCWFVDQQSTPIPAYDFLLQEPRLEITAPSGGDQKAPGSYGGIESSGGGSIGNFRVANPRDEKKPAGRAMSWLLDRTVQGQAFTLYRQTTPGEKPPQDLGDASWSTISGIVDALDDRSDIIIGQVLPTTELLEGNMSLETYRGWGSACLILGSGDEITWAHASTFEAFLVANWRADVFWTEFQIKLDTSVNDQALFRWGDGSSDGIIIKANISGNANLSMSCFGLTTPTVTSDNDVITDGIAYCLGFGRSVAGNLEIAIDGVVISSTATTGTVTDPAEIVRAGVSVSDCIIGEWRIWGKPPTEEVQLRWKDRLIDASEPGLVEVFRFGVELPSIVWSAVNDGNYDSDGDSGTPEFNYGGEGQPGDHGATKPYILGQRFWVKGKLVDSASSIMHYHHGDAIAVGAAGITYKGDLVDSGDYTVNSPNNGEITFGTIPGADYADHIRVSAITGHALTGDEYEDLVTSVVSDAGIGAVPSATMDATPLSGRPLDATAGLYIPSSAEPLLAAPLVEKVAQGAGIVLLGTPTGGVRYQRVPFEPFDPISEADARLWDRGNVTRVAPQGYAHRPRKLIEIAYARTEDVTEPGDIDFVAADADDTDVDAMQRPFRKAKFELPATTATHRQYVDQVDPVPSHITAEFPAVQEAAFMGGSQLTYPKVRLFEVEIRDTVDGLYQFGAMAVLHSGIIEGAGDGIPCRVLGYTAGGASGKGISDRVTLLEQPVARVAPDELIASSGFTAAALSQVTDDPISDSTDFATAPGSVAASMQLGFPLPNPINTAVDCRFRIRFHCTGSGTAALTVWLYEDGVVVSPGDQLSPELLLGAGYNPTGSGDDTVELSGGEDVVLEYSWDPADLTDLSEAELYFEIQVAASTTANIYGADYAYQVL